MDSQDKQFRLHFPELEVIKRPHWVYIFGTSEWYISQKCKIGYTASIQNRKAKIEAASGRKLHIHHIIPCPGVKKARDLEQCLHFVYKRQRERGEWFFLSEQDLRVLANIENYAHFYEMWSESGILPYRRDAA